MSICHKCGEYILGTFCNTCHEDTRCLNYENEDSVWEAIVEAVYQGGKDDKSKRELHEDELQD